MKKINKKNNGCANCCYTCTKYIPAVFVIGLSTYGYLTYIITFCLRLVFPFTAASKIAIETSYFNPYVWKCYGLTNFIFITSIYILLLISYFKTMLTHPGSVPVSWVKKNKNNFFF